MTEQEIKEKIEIYMQYLKDGNKAPNGTDMYIEMIEQLELELLEKMVAGGDGGSDPVRPLSMNEMLMINSATATSVGTVSKKGKISRISLRLPICAKVGSRITLSRRVGTRWRLIGHGTIVG